MQDMEEYLYCLDKIAETNHIDEETFEFEEKPKPKPEDNNQEIEIKEDDPSPTSVPEEEAKETPAIPPEVVELDENNPDVI